MTIRNPVEWGVDQFRLASAAMGSVVHAVGEDSLAGAPAVRRIGMTDLRDALVKGVADFGACRSDVIFLCIVYPVAGLVLARLAFNYEMLPLLFPLASGFALVGPIAGLGLYEMSRRREQGAHASLPDAFGIVRSHSFGAILALGLMLILIYLVWLVAALWIYDLTLGPKPPESTASFIHDIITTGAGWVMIGVGMSVGFLFALLVLTISVVSFPMLLDREVPLRTAIGTSIRAVATNPAPMAAWGMILAGGLVIGSIPALLGLIVVMPVLGHATWHLYRNLVPR